MAVEWQTPTQQSNFFSENKMIQDIYLAYESERKANKCLDFDDLIVETVKLFKNNKDFKIKFQNQIYRKS